ncbi:MAG: pilus assembly PilX N-terminal domain-containing protein [Methylococcaceae bacterium]
MNNRQLSFLPTPVAQRGAVTLVAVLVLVICMALLTLTTSRTGIVEQQITGNDVRAREVQEAAEAGLEYGVAWGTKNTLADGVTTCPGGTGCPTLSTITGSTSGETYSISSLIFNKGDNFIKVTSTAQGTDTSITATAESFIQQTSTASLFNATTTTPPPWVTAGCITNSPTGTPDMFLLSSSNVAVTSGSSSSNTCLPQGHLGVSEWADANGNGVMDSGEDGATATFNRDSFSGCPSTNCAWNHLFDMDLADAKQLAIDAGHVYAGSIPCGPTTAPSIYIINNNGPINPGDMTGSCSGTGVDNTTIGAPSQPILLIIPSAYGCPKFNGGITIYGIVYFESSGACASNGWGGATVYGSVVWEGNVDKPNANSQFIEVDYGNNGSELDDKFQILGIDDAARLPGTWKDF